MSEILTIGHSTHGRDEFCDRLEALRVETLVDVRRFPGSRRVPWTRPDELGAVLAERSILYLHLESLGGRRRPVEGSSNGAWRNVSFRGYADHLASGEFASGLATLEAAAKEGCTAMMCAEVLWWRCHRRLVADALTVRGWTVRHADLRGDPVLHELTPFAVVDGERLRYPAPAAESPEEPAPTSMGASMRLPHSVHDPS